LLAINPDSVAYISSAYHKGAGQNMLRLHLNNGRVIWVYEADAQMVLESLGLETEDWVLTLERDLG
jgi:hypothetical protein